MMSVCLCYQCVPLEGRCNTIIDCSNSADELQCFDNRVQSFEPTPAPPAVIYLGDGPRGRQFGNFSISCPETHFQCQGDGYCLPVFVRCNGVYDCPHAEDETGCEDEVVCPGFYRCRDSTVCLHPHHVCDNDPQCPRHDDEVLCNATCPPSCTCYGHAFLCTSPFHSEQFPDLRFLHAPGTTLTVSALKTNIMLVFLNLARCGGPSPPVCLAA